MKAVSARSLLPLAPAFCVFGPFILAITVEGPMHVWALAGALLTGAGSLILFLNLARQTRQIEELRGHLPEN